MFTLADVVPWGRSFAEYRAMFALADADLERRVLGCGDGPASFNAVATRRGARVVSCDPLYHWTAPEIRARIDATYQEVIDQTRRNHQEFVWSTIHSVEELGQIRMAAMNDFLDDYPAGRVSGRYLEAELPHLPFGDGFFDVALCSHLLFLYTTQLGEAFHQRAIREMCRVAGEVRIFPLLALGGVPSPLVDPVAAEFRAQGFNVSIEEVDYEFQRGGNKMMRIRRATPDTSPAP